MNKINAWMTAALLAGTMLTACATDPVGGGPVFSLVGEQQENAIGQETAQQLIKDVGVYEDGALEGYLNDVMGRVHAASDIANVPTTLVLLDTDEFNASATPGYMMVNRGLLPYMNSEAQLAAILGHETGHNAAHHVGESVTRGMLAQLALAGLGVYLGSRVENQAVAQGLYTAGGIGAGLTLMAYSRGQETEADQLGVRYMGRAGYDPREAYPAFAQMQALDVYGKQQYAAFEGKAAPADQYFGLLRSHPATPARMENIAQLAGGLPDGSVKLPAGATPATPATDPQGQKRYFKMIDGVAVGPNVKKGVTGRDYLALGKPRFVWRFGDGFISRLSTADGRSEWQISNPQTGVQGQLFFILKSGHLNPALAITQLDSGFDHVQNIKVAGLTAATATRDLGQFYARAVAVPLPASDMMAMIVYKIPAQNGPALEAPVMAATAGSLMLSEAQAKALQPLKLKIASVQGGDTPEKIAARLPQGALRVEYLSALNGWQPGQALRVSAAYKTVVDPNSF